MSGGSYGIPCPVPGGISKDLARLRLQFERFYQDGGKFGPGDPVVGLKCTVRIAANCPNFHQLFYIPFGPVTPYVD